MYEVLTCTCTLFSAAGQASAAAAAAAAGNSASASAAAASASDWSDQVLQSPCLPYSVLHSGLLSKNATERGLLRSNKLNCKYTITPTPSFYLDKAGRLSQAPFALIGGPWWLLDHLLKLLEANYKAER